ncbi:TonB-dependent receptor [Pseudomonas fluorescens]|jgi:vitamin B12 transporter|uniref:TonB-dependent receptor domain-containing protein n=1 Tax=unclassified Pseudomonas TaxID=196821 RepID=UPI0010C230D1|nr:MULTISPECIES: TonB-dependent receptor [unclassified Pseudomonas]TKK41228.1 TonB-dependent receptor [Pseudomonas fluorescens]MCF5509186.1 TonB-dependent receptor [Pseudomonas sp. PA-3-6H]MCF5514227.1 TonB-dependent receptor [Pseudomonas sp. PA-3-6E]MCF5561023.1 TonB-dependent receptor [Pseudomonas sp. PA-3-5D]MCF5565821.1 TonB-dependent receptor [Pseudomonas sp. PA-3-11C]
MKRLCLALLLLPCADLLADTRDQALKLSDVVISANRQVQARNDSSAANTVFTRADIDRLQPTSVTDLLSRVPGVQVAPTGGRGSLPGIFIRGTKTAQSLVMVDGQRIANATSGDSGLQFLSVDQIERVEVLRGSRSVIYGSDAIGGVIQIFTRRNAEAGIHPRLHLGFGSHQTWERSLGLSGGDGRTRFNLGASLDETQGIDWTRKSFASDGDHDAYRNNSISLNLSHSLSDDVEVGFNLLDGRGRAEYDNPFGRNISLTEAVGMKPYTRYAVSSASSYVDTKINDAWQTRVELGHSENRDTKRDRLSDYNAAFNTYRDSVNWQNDLSLTERNSLILGGDWYEDRVHTSENLKADSRWNRAVFIQHRFKAEAFSTELGLRHDTNQQFGSQNTWSGTFTLPLNPDNDLLLSYSEGFRAPSFNDLYYPFSSNPNLKPEHSKSYELQWRSQLTDTMRLEASLYRTELKDAIIARQIDFYIPRNVASARINGFEAALKQELFGWQGNLGLSIIDPRDNDSGHTLERRARRTLSLDLDRQFDRLGVGASWQAVSSSYDDAENTKRLSGYSLLGLRSSWAMTREVLLSVKVDNVLDGTYARARYSYDEPNYENNQDYREEGRVWMFGVTWTPEL